MDSVMDYLGSECSWQARVYKDKKLYILEDYEVLRFWILLHYIVFYCILSKIFKNSLMQQL